VEQSRPAVGSDPTRDPEVAEKELEEAFLQTVDEGRRRMSRRLVPLLATGFVGGIDVGTGVLALLLVEHTTHNHLLGGLAFSLGFVTLVMARSELFTENFLVPVSTVIARQARFRMLVRLWLGTAAANLLGGWLFAWLIIKGFPQWGATARTSGAHYPQLGISGRAFALAVIAGVVMTLMTWMQHNVTSMGHKVIPAIGAAFVLAGAPLNHAIVNSLLMFAALHTGRAPFGYADWAGAASWAALGNIVGGVGLVTLLRVLQVPHKVEEERANPAPGVPLGDDRRAHHSG
jgi:formate/nitrite transporter FocA (FNT family)